MAGPVPVVVGGDMGAYAIVRAFHERFGVRGVNVAKLTTRAFAHSEIADVLVADVDDESVLLETLEGLASTRVEDDLILLSNNDFYVELIVRNAERLRAVGFAVPVCSVDAFERISSKRTFQEDCEALGIPVPASVLFDAATATVAEDDALVASLTFPVIAKPSSSAEYYGADFPGKKKIYHLNTRVELDALLETLREAAYPGSFMLQEFIPGDETQMRSLTAYRDSHGIVTLLCTGRVLLEEHTPGALGIPAAILTEPYVDAMDAMEKYLAHIDYVGFANADYKRDIRTGKHVFFEVNPRVGRNNYYATAAGVNVADFVAADIAGERRDRVRADAEVLYTVVPLRLLMRYLLDRDLRRSVLRAARRGMAHPLRYVADRAPRRLLTVLRVAVSYVRNYRRYYPKPTADGA